MILTQIKSLQAGAIRRLRTLAPWFEQDCLLCAGVSNTDIVCSACAADLPRLQRPSCPRCAMPTPSGETCGHCLKRPPYFDAVHAAFAYDFPLDKLIQSFKYAHRLALGAYFGRQLSMLPHIEADLIIPLPFHRERLRERGFNQAIELARPVCRAWHLPIDATSCTRTRNTTAQAQLPWRQRIKNMRGAFHCSTDLTGKRIILIDDVMTSGASLNECARTLKLHGALEVATLVVARALPK